MDTIRLARSPKSTPLDTEPCVMALGYFDGVHLGHRSVILLAKTISERENVPLAVLTFDPHPKEIISQGKERVDYLMPMAKKADIMAGLGVDKLYIVDFTMDFARLPPARFVEEYLIGLQAVHVVTGFDFTYGHQGKGNVGTLASDGKGRFAATAVPKIERFGQKISSTRIRTMLRSGDVDSIAHYLGDYYTSEGEASKYLRNPSAGRAKARFTPHPRYMLPDCGTYKIQASVGKKTMSGVAHVKPGKGRPNQVEVELLDPCCNLSDFAVMEIKWLHRLNSSDGSAAPAEPVPVEISVGR